MPGGSGHVWGPQSTNPPAPATLQRGGRVPERSPGPRIPWGLPRLPQTLSAQPVRSKNVRVAEYAEYALSRTGTTEHVGFEECASPGMPGTSCQGRFSTWGLRRAPSTPSPRRAPVHANQCEELQAMVATCMLRRGFLDGYHKFLVDHVPNQTFGLHVTLSRRRAVMSLHSHALAARSSVSEYCTCRLRRIHTTRPSSPPPRPRIHSQETPEDGARLLRGDRSDRKRTMECARRWDVSVGEG
jgi:hypothetical protein